MQINITAGLITAAVMPGYREAPKVGDPVLIRSVHDPDWVVPTRLRSIRLCRLRSLNREELDLAGASGHAALLSRLRQVTGGLGSNPSVTLVRWRPPEGA